MSSVKRKRAAIISLSLLLAFFVLFLLPGDPVRAQDFGTGYLSGTSLPTEDVRFTVIRFINIALGVLGVIFLFFVLYAGFIWMTAGGNVQQTTKAKKILINAVTGLVIIFMAFAITRFVFNLLSGTSGGGVPGGPCTDGEVSGCLLCSGGVWNYDPGIPGCSLPGSEFRINTIETANGSGSPDQDVYLCSSVQANTNNVIDQSTVPGNVSLTAGGSAVAAILDVSSRSVELRPTVNLAANTTYTAHYATALADSSGLNLSACAPFGCSLSGQEFVWNLTTGSSLDPTAPSITSTNPTSDTASPGYPDRNASRDEVIRVVFSEAVRSSTIDDGSGAPVGANIIVEEISSQGGSVVAALPGSDFEVITAANRFDLRLKPPRLYQPFTWHRVTIRNIEDLCGNAMSAPKVFEFQTNSSAPGVGGKYPTGSNVCPDVGVVTLTFNTSMYYDLVGISLDNGISPFGAALRASDLSPGPYQAAAPEGVWSVDPASDFRVFTFTLNDSLNPGATYNINITTDRVIDINGNTLNHVWSFTVGEPASCTCSPHISSINPNSGYLGQCVTINGQCFNGAVPGDPSDPRHAVISALTFENVPAQIGSQAGNYVVSSVPASFAAGDRPLPQVTITYNDPALGSLTTNNSNVDFFVSANEQAQGPCLLSLSPPAACWGENLRLNGLRFGTDPGAGNRATAANHVSFNDNNLRVPDPQVQSWSDTRVDLQIPNQAADGNASLTASGLTSNLLPFDLQCGAGVSCSATSGFCTPNPAVCEPGLVCNPTSCLCESASAPGAPLVVVKEPVCSQSCTNAGIWAEFNADMSPATINASQIDVKPCGVDCLPSNLGSEIAYANIAYDAALRRANISPAGPLTGGVGYRVIFYPGMTNSVGLPLGGLNFDSDGNGSKDSYSWTFATKNQSCQLTGVSLSPLVASASAINQTVGFNAYAQGSNQQCGNQAINRHSLNWSWTSSNPAVATISNSDSSNDGRVDPQQSATALSEGLTNITASSGGFTSASSPLTVDVITCDETTDCTQGGVCASSTCDQATKTCTPVIKALSPNSGPVGRWTTVQGCYFGSSRGSGKVTFDTIEAVFPACGGGTWQNSQIIVEVPNVNFGARDVVVQTDRGLVSNIIKFNLIDTCSGVPVPPGGVPGICSLSPGSGSVNTNVRVAGVRFGASQNSANDLVTYANTSGGRSQASVTSWSEASIQALAPTDAASGGVIVEVNSCPSNAVNFNVTLGQGSACSGLQNSCLPDDSRCGSSSQLYCQPSTCTCQLSPASSVVRVTPPPPSANVCRNTVIEVEFSQMMNISSLPGNVILEAPDGSPECVLTSAPLFFPDRFNVLANRLADWLGRFFYGIEPAIGQSWCQVGSVQTTSQTLDVNQDGKFTPLQDHTLVRLSPTRLLEADTLYRARILTGAKNWYGRPLATEFAAPSFTTGQNACQISRVEVRIFPSGEITNRDIFYCAGSDNCSEDQDGQAGNQHRWLAQAYDLAGLPVTASYHWTESDPDDIFSISQLDANEVFITPTAVLNGSATFSVGASGLSGGSTGGATSTVVARTELCQNPWPARPDTPFVDGDTDFSFWYCRDRGDAADLSDDLPALSVVEKTSLNNPGSGQFAIAAIAPVSKEFLFLLPSPSIDAIAMRVHPNTDLLSPIEWYKRHVTNQGSPQSYSVNDYEAIREGRTVYVNAAQHTGGLAYRDNIYILSYNQNASSDTQSIYNLLLQNWEFTLNLLDQNICSGDPSLFCSADEICDTTQAGTCLVPATKIRRDARRVTDLGGVRSLLLKYFGQCSNDESQGCDGNDDCFGGACLMNNGNFPTLLSGSFIQGQSTSRWPSWKQTLGNQLGVGGGLSVDPFNSFSSCPAEFDQASCWDEVNRVFQCADGSHIYQYEVAGGGSGFDLYANLELDNINWLGFGSSGSSDDCRSVSIDEGS